jgi:hypothetical protein
MIALAVLVERLGGQALISQADIDRIAYTRLLEGWAENGSAVLKVEHKTGTRPQ